MKERKRNIKVFLWLLIGRRFKHAFIYAAVVAAAVAPWVLYVALNGEFTYVAHSGIAEIGFMGLLSRIAYHTGRYLFELLPVLLSPSLAFSKIASVVSGSILTLVVIAGLYSVIRKDKPRLIVLTLLCFIPVYLIYEFVSLRYISILAPAIVFLIACSGGLILKTLTHQERSAKLGSVIIVALLLVGMLPTFIQGVAYTNNYRRQLWKSESRNDAVIPLTPEAASFYKALRWCEKDTPEDAILISAELRIAYFISDRQGIWIGSSKSDEIWEKALKYGATYIILDRTSELILAKFVSAIEPHIKCFKTVYRTKEPCAFVLEIDTTCLREKIGD